MDLIKIAFGLVLTVSSCVPVSYDSLVWNRQSVTPDSHSGVWVTPGLRSERASALNSSNMGPWKIVLSVRAREKCTAHLEFIEISGDGSAMNKLEINHEIPIELHPSSGEWRGVYITENPIISVFSTGRLVLGINLKINRLSSYKVTAIFSSKRIKGKETVNLLTM